MRQHREPDPHHSSVACETTQPTPHRRHRHPNQQRHPAMTTTGRLQRQRGTDHLDPITTAQQTVSADQHMRDRTNRALRTSRTDAPLNITTAQNPPPRPPPRTQPAGTTRALQLPSNQRAFDFQPIRSYNLQQCPRASGRTLPSPAKVRSGRVLARSVQALSHQRRQQQQKAAPAQPSPPPMSLQQPRVLNRHGAQQTLIPR